MEHLAIDLGGRESQICVRKQSQEVIEERRLPTTSLKKYLQARPRSRVILETCAESFHIADQALELGHEVPVVPATLVRSLGVGARGIKTDQRDARVLSEVSCRVDLPSVHIPSTESRELKAVNGLREVLVGGDGLVTRLESRVRFGVAFYTAQSLFMALSIMLWSDTDNTQLVAEVDFDNIVLSN